MNLYDKVFPPKVIVLPNGKNVTKPRSRAPLAAAVLLALTVLSVKVTGFDMSLLARRIKEFFVILGQMIPPQWSYMPQIWQPLFDTIKMSLLGSVIGSLLVVPFAMLASSNIIHNRAVVSVMRLILSIIRTLPTLVTALIATYVFGLGTLAGTTAIAVFTFAYIGKILYEEIETETWARLKPWRPWVLPKCAHSSVLSCRRCFPPTFPTACSALRAMCATPPSWAMWGRAALD